MILTSIANEQQNGAFQEEFTRYAEDIDSDEEGDTLLNKNGSRGSCDADLSLDGGISCFENEDDESGGEDVLAPSKKQKRIAETEREDEQLSNGNEKKRKITKKSGPKSPWSPEMMNDLVDIVANSQRYQRKLIFTNSPTASSAEVYTQIVKETDERCKKRGLRFELNVNQTRNKFKKLMRTCKTALLTIKTASGIKRFQDEKQYETWFNRLLQLMKS